VYSFVEENYLKSLFNLADEKGEVTTLALSEYLNIKMPTVNSMMKRLSEKGLVTYKSYKPLKLSEKGKKEAALILRKHRLTEMYLVEKMKFSWEEVHEVAEQIEHIHSEKFFDKMDELLQYPKFDPHGSPIPDSEGNIEWMHYKKMSECETEKKIIFSAVINSSSDFLKYLNSKNLSLGMVLEIIHIEDFDKSLTVRLSDNNRTEIFSHVVAEKLLVKEII
jgi:DtxR family Mn-dependent transcriptional regulator